MAARRAVNSTEVARRAGVSRTTVSFVLNGRDDMEKIPLATRERVVRAAEELGYRPNHLARVLLSGRSYLINLLVRRVHPAFFSRAIAAFQAALLGSGYDLRVQETADWTPERWREAATDRWPVDGTIVIEEERFVPHLLAALQGRLPVVSVGTTVNAEVDHIRIDVESGVVAALRHLRETGRERIGFLVPAHLRHTSRAQAYQAEQERVGAELFWISPKPRWDISERAQAREIITGFVAEGETLDALVCFNDEFAIGALRALKDCGKRVPEDIALVGCDDIEETEYHDPPLSTLHYPYERAARLAWEMLRLRIEEPESPVRSEVLQSELVVRESSLILPANG